MPKKILTKHKTSVSVKATIRTIQWYGIHMLNLLDDVDVLKEQNAKALGILKQIYEALSDKKKNKEGLSVAETGWHLAIEKLFNNLNIKP